MDAAKVQQLLRHMKLSQASVGGHFVGRPGSNGGRRCRARVPAPCPYKRNLPIAGLPQLATPRCLSVRAHPLAPPYCCACIRPAPDIAKTFTAKAAVLATLSTASQHCAIAA